MGAMPHRKAARTCRTYLPYSLSARVPCIFIPISRAFAVTEKSLSSRQSGRRGVRTETHFVHNDKYNLHLEGKLSIVFSIMGRIRSDYERRNLRHEPSRAIRSRSSQA